MIFKIGPVTNYDLILWLQLLQLFDRKINSFCHCSHLPLMNEEILHSRLLCGRVICQVENLFLSCVEN